MNLTCHQVAPQSIAPGVSTSRTPKVQVAIIAGVVICFSSRRSITLNRSLASEPRATWQWYTYSRGR